jgi:hypothetical protein
LTRQFANHVTTIRYFGTNQPAPEKSYPKQAMASSQGPNYDADFTVEDILWEGFLCPMALSISKAVGVPDAWHNESEMFSAADGVGGGVSLGLMTG